MVIIPSLLAIGRGAVLTAALLSLPWACLGTNLILNGGFETPGSSNYIPGWTNWRASWGSGEVRAIVTNTKVSGSRSLAMTCNSSSFGVYQEVNVTPGKAYQMNGWWRGSFPVGVTTWYDCELLDGPFDIVLADSRPPDLPYKVCTYDPATAVFDWQRMSDAYYTTLALLQEAGGHITRNGIRVASGNKLTVVLKTGGFSHPYGYYDDVTLEEVPQMSIVDAKTQPDSKAVMIAGGTVTATFPGYFYVQSPDRVSAIRVNADTYSAAVGQAAKVVGVMRTTNDGEPAIEASYVSCSGTGSPKPLAMSVRALSASKADDAPNTLGLLVTVCGKVTRLDSHTFTLDDGSGATVKCVTPSDVIVSPSWTFARVTGISACYKFGAGQRRMLRVRQASDIVL